MEIIHVTCIY